MRLSVESTEDFSELELVDGHLNGAQKRKMVRALHKDFCFCAEPKKGRTKPALPARRPLPAACPARPNDFWLARAAHCKRLVICQGAQNTLFLSTIFVQTRIWHHRLFIKGGAERHLP